jgi:hypothetical protein
VRVAWARLRLDPPELGTCEEPSCRSVSIGLVEPFLVAVYATPGDGARGPVVLRVCGPCDERILERYFADEDNPRPRGG